MAELETLFGNVNSAIDDGEHQQILEEADESACVLSFAIIREHRVVAM